MNIDFDGVYQCEYVAFDMYFASICSMQVHPGAGSKDHKIMSLVECRDMAIEMLKLRRALPVYGKPNLEEVVSCHGE